MRLISLLTVFSAPCALRACVAVRLIDILVDKMTMGDDGVVDLISDSDGEDGKDDFEEDENDFEEDEDGSEEDEDDDSEEDEDDDSEEDEDDDSEFDDPILTLLQKGLIEECSDSEGAAAGSEGAAAGSDGAAAGSDGAAAALSAVTAALSGPGHEQRIRWLSQLRSSMNGQFLEPGHGVRKELDVSIDEHQELMARRVACFRFDDSGRCKDSETLQLLRHLVRGVNEEELTAVIVLFECLRVAGKSCAMVLDVMHSVTLAGILLSALDPPNPGRWRDRALVAFCCGEAGTSKTGTLMSMLKPLMRKVTEVNVHILGGEKALNEVNKLLAYRNSLFADDFFDDGHDEVTDVEDAFFNVIRGTHTCDYRRDAERCASCSMISYVRRVVDCCHADEKMFHVCRGTSFHFLPLVRFP